MCLNPTADMHYSKQLEIGSNRKPSLTGRLEQVIFVCAKKWSCAGAEQRKGTHTSLLEKLSPPHPSLCHLFFPCLRGLPLFARSHPLPLSTRSLQENGSIPVTRKRSSDNYATRLPVPLQYSGQFFRLSRGRPGFNSRRRRFGLCAECSRNGELLSRIQNITHAQLYRIKRRAEIEGPALKDRANLNQVLSVAWHSFRRVRLLWTAVSLPGWTGGGLKIHCR